MLIVFDGVDKTGKSTLCNIISKKFSTPIFHRKNKMLNSSINLEESFKYDWDILLDYFESNNDQSHCIFDRSFFSQYPYSLVFRTKNVAITYNSLIEYKNIFKNYYERSKSCGIIFFYCTRKDIENNKEEKYELNKKVFDQLDLLYNEIFQYCNIDINKINFENGIENNTQIIIDKIIEHSIYNIKKSMI